jgi:hypothetical protein
VPYPTDIPPLVGRTPLPTGYLGPLLHISSVQRVLVGVDASGRPATLHVRQRLVVHGKGDYQLGVSAPVADVRAGPGSESEPGLRTDQVLWAGFSPGRKVLAADVTLRPRDVVRYLPLRLRVRRDGNRVRLTVTNATVTREISYGGVAQRAELARLLDETRRSSLAGQRLKPAYATFAGLPRTLKQKVPIEAPLRVEGELRLPGRAPVSFDRVLGDGTPLSFAVEALGGGTPHVHLVARTAPVVTLLQPPGSALSWSAAIRRRPLPASFLLGRLLGSRMRLVRADQYRSFLSNPDTAGPSSSVYEYDTVAVRPHPPGAVSPSNEGGTSALVVLAIVVGSVALAGGGLVLWAHS